jgi:hypothetical protein
MSSHQREIADWPKGYIFPHSPIAHGHWRSLVTRIVNPNCLSRLPWMHHEHTGISLERVGAKHFLPGIETPTGIYPIAIPHSAASVETLGEMAHLPLGDDEAAG